jgi:YHS domain-containing protein
MMGQSGKQRFTVWVIAAWLGVAGGAMSASGQDSAGQALAESVSKLPNEIVVNRLTGVAINGMDAVSFFTEQEPLAGSRDFVFKWGGVPWYFSSEANRQVFAAAPEVYAPRFGGHGLASISRGFLSDGNPRIYTTFYGRLYFFYSSGNRQAFLASPVDMLEAAAANWPELRAGLVQN